MVNNVKLIAAILILSGLGLAGGEVFAAEFEVLDKLSVDGYSEFRGSAAVTGDLFTVGASTLVIKAGNVGIGTTAPQQRLHVTGVIRSEWDTINTRLPQLELRRLTSGVFDGSSFSVDIGMGLGLTNLVGGAAINSAGSGYDYLGIRGASRINLGDGNVYIYTSSAAAGTAGTPVTWSNNSTAALMIDNNGNTGIGTVSPGATLDVKTGAGNTYAVKVSSNDGTVMMAIQHNGNVGIGAMNPAATLDVGGTDAIKMPVGTTAQRPASSVAGMVRFNATLGVAEYYTGTAWVPFNYAGVTPGVEYLIVAGGGGGGYRYGGGGAGGYRTAAGLAVTAGVSLPVTVGAGGSGGLVTTSTAGSQGGSSSLYGITATGGGGGGSSLYPPIGLDGGSGGGGGGNGNGLGTVAGGAGISGQGYAGGTGWDQSGNNGGGGGGGASQAGSAAGGANGYGKGGDGLLSSISGVATYYAGGGGGTGQAGGIANGGAGGGGKKGVSSGNGSANTGGGGASGLDTAAGSGGSGIVIIRYPDIYAAAAATTGSPANTVSGGYRIYTWTIVGSGSITF